MALPILNMKNVEEPILVVSPHPDDDVLGSGGFIQRALRAHKAVYVVYVTTGDANGASVTRYLHKRRNMEAYRELGRVRHAEAVRAEEYLGVPRSHLFFLGFPDGIMYGIATDPILERIHRSPYTGFTRAAYSFAYKRNTSYSHGSAVHLMESILRKVRPKTVILNLGMDIHPDHKATRIITLQAIQRLGMRPTLYAYLIHYPHWPTRGGLLLPPRGVHLPGAMSFPLTVHEERKTRTAYSLHRSQSTLIPNNYNLIRRNELFWKQYAYRRGKKVRIRRGNSRLTVFGTRGDRKRPSVTECVEISVRDSGYDEARTP